MTYKELVEKLNEKYNTDIFYTYYTDLDLNDESRANVDVKIGGLKGVTIWVNPETLELSDLGCYQKIDGNTLGKLGDGLKALEQYEQQQATIKELTEKLAEAEKELAKVEELKAVRDFAQETILKAISGARQ